MNNISFETSTKPSPDFFLGELQPKEKIMWVATWTLDVNLFVDPHVKCEFLCTPKCLIFKTTFPETCALKERNYGEEKESHQDAPKGLVDQEFFHHCTVFFSLWVKLDFTNLTQGRDCENVLISTCTCIRKRITTEYTLYIIVPTIRHYIKITEYRMRKDEFSLKSSQAMSSSWSLSHLLLGT